MINSRFWKCSLLVCALAGCSCTMTLGARLYDLDTAEIMSATYKANGTGHGPIWIGSQKIEDAICKGEYSTVPSGESGWGMIFGAGAPAMVLTSALAADQRGRAIATCTDGRLIECEYVTNQSSSGHGACQDNKGKRYRLMF